MGTLHQIETEIPAVGAEAAAVEPGVKGAIGLDGHVQAQLLQGRNDEVTPAAELGPAAADRFLRLSFASSMSQLQEAASRLQRELGRM